MSGVCLAGGVTQRSFLSTLSSSIGKTLGDDGVLYLTSGTEIDFTKIPEEPTVFFIRIPDHKTERHPLGVLCISQLYKVLVDVANKTVNSKGKTGALKRPVYFILDEFGNMPAVPNFGTMVTVSRSRKIFFEIILQSYKQLDIKYGQDEAQNIRGNFQMEVFLGSEDPSTIQAFSEACGETTVFHKETSSSRSTKDDSQGETLNTSTQRNRKPLIDKQELRQLPKWTVVAKIFRKSIMKDVMTPFFATKCMEKKSAPEIVGLSKKLDIQSIYYDIDRRNAIVMKPKNPFED
jgi:type IV secretion system protein VirD4